MRTAPLICSLLSSGCLLGVDPFDGVPNVPTLEVPPTVLSPLPGLDDVVRARAGTEVVIELRLLSPIDLDASRVALDGAPLTCRPTEAGAAAYLCSITLKGDEGNGAKGLTGTLAFAQGATTRLVSEPLLIADFQGPSAACVLSPNPASEDQTVTLVITPSEPLSAPPTVTTSSPELTIASVEPLELDDAEGLTQYVATLAPTPGLNFNGYELTVTAFDQAGNPQVGESLCPAGSRTGTILGVGPRLDGEVSLTATPSVEVGGTTWVRAGALLTARLPTVDPIDPEASTVALSGLSLTPLPSDPGAWTVALDGSEGDGLKALDATLLDAAGNSLRLQRPGFVRFDFTPPTADCVLAPREANGSDVVTFDVLASEPLAGGAPTVTSSDPRVTVSSPVTTGTRHRYTLAGTPGVDVSYTLEVRATDRAGNDPSAPLCDVATRSGTIRARGPVLDGPITVELEPSTELDGHLTARKGALLTVTARTEEPVDAQRSRVSLAGLPLDRQAPGVWTRVLDGSEGDGLKSLDVQLLDAAGNLLSTTLPDVARLDFRAPAGACFLSPDPANGEQVVTFAFTPEEPLGQPPAISSPTVEVSPPAFDGTRWLAQVRAPADADTLYTLSLQATDRIGNTAADDAVCALADRSGRVIGVDPTATDLTLTASGDATFTAPGQPTIVGPGAVLTVSLASEAALDPARTVVQVGEIRLAHAGGLTWTHTVSPGDVDGPKALTVTLVDVAGNQAPVDAGGQGVIVDLSPPAASCVLTPKEARIGQAARFEVRAYEPLSAVDVRSSNPEVRVSPTSATGTTYAFSATADAGSDRDYVLAVEATDRVGNHAASLCDEAERTGRLRYRAPALLALPEVRVAPSRVLSSGTPSARADDTVSVTLAPATPIDPVATRVTLSGIELHHDGGEVWSLGLQGDEGDGLKDLRVQLVDDVGNLAVVLVEAAVRFDFTGPTATCALYPRNANATDTITLEIDVSEPLAEGVLSLAGSGPLQVSGPVATESTYVFTLTPPATPTDLDPYTLTLTATDALGNPQVGASLCAEDNRTGTLKGVGPVLTGPVVLDVSPSLADAWGRPRATDGAMVTVILPTAEPLDPLRSFVALSGIPLSSGDGRTWTAQLDRAAGDGLKTLTSTLVDPYGNRLIVDDPTVALVADFSPPEIASAVLQRTPSFGPADDGSGRVWFTRQDPLTRQAVSASLRVTTTEDVGAEPLLAVSGPAPAPFTLAGSTSRLASWSLGAIPEGADGDYTFTVVLEDELANRSAPITLGVTMTVDTQAPAASVDVQTSDRTVYARSPWGGIASAEATFEISGLAGAALPGALVTAENRSGTLVASTSAHADGSFDELHLPADLPEVFVRSHDAAGNPGPRALVRDVVWTASLGGKIGGSLIENPHRLLELDDLAGGPAARPGLEQDALPVDTVREPPWLPWEGTGTATPAERYGHAMAYDARRGVTVLFGGTSTDAGSCGATAGQRCADTWEWDGQTWTERQVDVQPPARVYAALAYDAQRGVTVLFGGVGAVASCGGTGFYCGDTWEWDGSVWTQRSPAAAPPPRYAHALAYDTQSGVAVLFGGLTAAAGACGTTSSTACSDTWEWDGSVWTQRVVAGGPPARHAHAMAHDPSRGVTVLFGGLGTGPGSCGTANNQRCADTWEWDGQAWTRREVGTAPTARSSHVLAYDTARARIVLAGGKVLLNGTCGTAGSVYCADTWEWDGQAWTERTAASPPPARASHAAAYDIERGDVVLFGGTSAAAATCGSPTTPACNDTWKWDGTTWRSRAPSVRPPARNLHAMAYDDLRGVTVLFGGVGTAPGSCGDPGGKCADTWEWDGRAWTLRPTVVHPSARYGHAMAFDAARGVTVLFGGFEDVLGSCGAPAGKRCADTWEWDGEQWEARAPTTSPSPRSGHSLAYDAGRGVTVLFGGRGTTTGGCGAAGIPTCGDTWEWDGQTWTDRTTLPGTRACYDHAMVYDADLELSLVHGGNCYTLTPGLTWSGSFSDEIWAWDGTTWVDRTPATTPAGRYLHRLAYDARRGLTVLHGGASASGSGCGPTGSTCSDTWTWDGDAWTRREPSPAPGTRSDHALVYDTERGATLLFGGITTAGGCEGASDARCGDTWLLPSEAAERPGHTFTAAFAPARAAAATLRSVTARWIAAGEGTPDGQAEPGVELLVWNGLAWTLLDAHTSPPAAPAPLCAQLVADPTSPATPDCAELPDPALVRGLFRQGVEQSATFAVRTVAPIGWDTGRLRTGGVEIAVRYRLPAP